MSVVLSYLSFSFPNGRVVLSQLNATFGPGRTGLIGVNGSGKSTLLRLITGDLVPTSGSVIVSGDVGYLPQNLTLNTSAPVASLLGITAALDAIAAIQAGDVRSELFDAVGDDWDVADRAHAWLSRLGLGHVGLGDPVGRLSGGEAVLTALAALFLRRPPVIVLDEPTNNLDLDARRRWRRCSGSGPRLPRCVRSRPAIPRRGRSTRSATTGTSRTGRGSGWTGWASATSGSTTRCGGCPAARRS